MALRALRQAYMEIPLVTRVYTTACLLTTIAVKLDVIAPFQIHFSPDLIVTHFQLWRLVTNFVVIGALGLDFLINIVFLYHCCRMLEEGSFRGKTGDFVFFLLLGATIMTIIASFVNVAFLGPALMIMVVYVWGRRNPDQRVLLIEMPFFDFTAPYLPWVLVGYSLFRGEPIILLVIGITCGHTYYFLEDVFPRQERGFKMLHTPHILKWMFDPPAGDPLPEQDRPGEFGEVDDNQDQAPGEDQNRERQ